MGIPSRVVSAPDLYGLLMQGGEPLTLRDLVIRPAWHANAACRDSDVSFFPERGESLAPARALCASCPVHDQCLDYVMSTNEPVHGVWAGLSDRERAKLRRRRNQHAA